MPSPSHPYNVLMILADQHHAGLLGCAGHPQVKTPHLDAFARSAMRFESAYCANPICTPSRTSILSGQYCHNHGLFGLSGPSPARLPSLFSHFRGAGYRTAAFGKLHLPCRPQNWIADHVDQFDDAYETREGVIGRSAYLDYLEHIGVRELEDSWHNLWNYGPTPISLDAQPSKLAYEHTMEQWCVDRFTEFIDAAPQAPFCAQIAFQKPHHPLLPQQRFWDLYDRDLGLPITFQHSPALRPPHFRAQWKHMREMTWDFAASGESTEVGARRAWRGTLACISQIDDVFGRLMQEVSQRGLADNTIVIYSSDHGAYHGIHGIAEKAPGICSDAVCRVPLLIRVPGITSSSQKSCELIESVDLAPTLTALCGLPAMDTADGLDFSAVLRGAPHSPRSIAVTENPFSKSLRWGKWRYVYYPAGMFPNEDAGELYDLDSDPSELRNLHGEPSVGPIIDACRRQLLDWLIKTTRITTSHPAVAEQTGAYGRRDEIVMNYPVAADGKAPARIQPHRRSDNSLNYL